MKGRQRPQRCRCQEDDAAGIEFQKILESEEAGIVIYRYVPDTYCAGNAESFLIKNTKKQQATSEHFTIAFEQNKIICPRCVKSLEHAESLVKYIPLIESQDVISICDHCHRKGEKERPRLSCWCKQIVNKILIDKQLEEVKSKKHRIKQWLLEASQVLQNESSRIDKRLIKNKAMDKDVAQVDHVPFKQVTPTDSPPTRLKIRQLSFPEIVYTDLHELMRRDPSFNNAMPKVNPVENLKFKQFEPTDGPSTGLKVRKPSFPESVQTDSHRLMRRDPSLDNSLQKYFEKREPTLNKLSEEKQWEKKERKETAPFKVASFLNVPEENVTPSMCVISKSQRGKIKETQKRPNLKREKNLATERESRGLPVTSNRHLPKGSLKPVSEHDLTKVFSFLFPGEIITTSTSFRLATSTELFKNMQDMFKAQAEQEKLAKQKIIGVAQLITGENDKKPNTLTKDTDSSSGFDKKKRVERTSIDKEASKNENAYTAAETNENKDHRKKEKEKKREKEDGKDKEEKDNIKKDKQEHDRIDKEEKRRERQDQIHKNKVKYDGVQDEILKGVISKDAASKGAILKEGKQKREKPGDENFKPEKAKEHNLKHVIGKEKRQKDLVQKEDKSSQRLKDKSVTAKDGTSKREKPGDETFKPDKAKEDKKDKKRNSVLKYTLVTSQPTLMLKDKPEEKVFNVVIPERPKPIMVVEKSQPQPIKKGEIKLTKTREDLIMKLIRMKQSQYGSREKRTTKHKVHKEPRKVKIESKEDYALYTESDVLLELAELEENSKHAGPSKRRDDGEGVIIGNQIFKENFYKNLKEAEEEIEGLT